MVQCQNLVFTPSSAVAQHIAALGRTEDAVFSPDQTRLAIAGFNENKVLVIQIEVVSENGIMSVRSEECVELLCPDFNRPHGLSWIDDDTLVVANRGEDVILVSVPAVSNKGGAVVLEPELRLSEGCEDIIASPGSVDVVRLDDEYFDLLVCNNYRNYVSRHIIKRKNGFTAIAGVPLFKQGLKVPDGIAISRNGELVAISNHDCKRVDVFPNHPDSATATYPVASLEVSHYPHGVRFAMEDRLLLVADAGAPMVHVFVRNDTAWTSAKSPHLSLKVIADEVFRRGQRNPQEGGPKGLDILADGSLLVVSCEALPIAFFDFRPLRDRLVKPDLTNLRQVRSSDARLLDTVMAIVKAQHDQIGALRAELAKSAVKKALPRPSLDRRIWRLLKRLAQDVNGGGGTG